MHKLLLAVIVTGLTPLAAERVTEDLLVRLRTPVTTLAKAGTRFVGVVTGCANAECATILPPGSTIHGYVKDVRAVGFGVKRERASMTLAFDGCNLPDGEAVACESKLRQLDNARETVTNGNRIHGILAANHPHAYLGGLWLRPTSALLPRSLSGLTGAGRMIYTGISPHPAVAGAIIATRLAVLRMPDPEIQLPAGVELILRVTTEARTAEALAPMPPAPDALGDWLQGAPVRVTMPDGSPAADIVNTVFQGTAHEISSAFLGAGWATADPLNGRTYARSYRAFTSMKPYPTAPVSPLRYEGRLPDLVFQKSFNCMAKRHHIRLWRVESPDGPVWLGAATHDVGIFFDWKRMVLTHRIDPEIDRERDRVLADLTYAGCVAEAARVERPALATERGKMVTDGAVHVIAPRTCSQAAPGVAGPVRKVSFGKAMLRRTVLESRHYLLRGNGYYWAFRGLKSRSARTLFTKSAGVVAGRRPVLALRSGGAGRDRTDE